jgi:hypothetical protein
MKAQYSLAVLATAILFLMIAHDARAECGDVTDDGECTATDALAVLQHAVGQPVSLVCEGEGPSQLRFYNPFYCDGQNAVSQARIGGVTWSADSDAFAQYEKTGWTVLANIEIDVCGTTLYFPGPINVAPDRSITFYVALLDPNVYQIPGVEWPAMFIMNDDGMHCPDSVAGETMPPTVHGVYGGAQP